MAIDVRDVVSPAEVERHHREVVSELDQKWAMAEQAARDTFRLWRENIAFIEGVQWIRSRDGLMLNVQGVSRNRIRVPDNRLLDHARRLHARLDQVAYSPTAIADSLDEGDKQAARAAGAILRWFNRKTSIRPERRKINWWLVVCGQAYIEAYFDPQAGPLVEVPVLDENGQPVLEQAVGPDGQPVFEAVLDENGNEVDRRPVMEPKMTLEPEGMVGFIVRSPFSIRRDPRFQDWKKLRWIFVEETASREEVLDRFGGLIEDLEKKLPSVPHQTDPWMPEVVPDTLDMTGLPRPRPVVKDVVTLRRYFERPSRKYPRGRFVVYAGSLVLYEGDMPTPDRDFPVVPFSYMARPWYMEGKSAVDASKPLQRLYNRILSRFAEHLVRLPAGWLLVPATSGIPKRSFTSETGSVIRYIPGGGDPKFVFPPFGGLAWYERFLARLEASMEDRMALPPAVRGQLPKGARAARTVELLQEAADTIQAPVLNDLADSWARFYKLILMLVHKHFTVDRIVRIIGEDKTSETYEFKGETLPRDWTDRIDVRVEAGESLPSSKMMRIEFILTLAQRHGFFGQPGTPEYIKRLGEALDLDAGFMKQEGDVDVSIAEDENVAIFRGEEVHAREWDDHLIHLRTHLAYMKRMVLAKREEEAEKLLPHFREHQAFVAELAKGMAMRSAADVQAQQQEQAAVGTEQAVRQMPPVPRTGGTGPTTRVMENVAEQVMGGQGGGAT